FQAEGMTERGRRTVVDQVDLAEPGRHGQLAQGRAAQCRILRRDRDYRTADLLAGIGLDRAFDVGEDPLHRLLRHHPPAPPVELPPGTELVLEAREGQSQRHSLWIVVDEYHASPDGFIGGHWHGDDLAVQDVRHPVAQTPEVQTDRDGHCSYLLAMV